MPALGLGFSVLRPAFLALLLVLPAMYLAWRTWPPPMARRRSRLALVLRALLVALLVFALAGVRVSTLPQKRAVVAVVDLSGSLRDSSAQQEQAVRTLEAKRGPADAFGVVTFAHDAAVEMPVSDHPDQFDTFQTKPDPNFTDLSGALRLASGLIPDGYARQLVLITDGLQNLGDAAATVAALRAEGVRVDVLAVGKPPAAEALVLATEAPSELREGQTLNVNVRLRSTVPSSGTLTVFVDEQEVSSRPVELPAGTSAQSFDVPNLGVGLHPIRVELQVKPDTYADNNVGAAAVRVLGRPTVLVLEGTAGEGANVQAALETTGVKVERRLAAQAPADTSTLGRYDGIVIVDAAADSFPGGSLAAIAASVKELGHGLVTIGGPTSYGPGGWQGTPLEDALPVRMDLPNRKDKPRVAVVLVMETMEDPRADQVVLGAAEAVIDKLSPDDEVGVTDGMRGFLVPLQPATDKKAIDAKLETASLGDPPDYGQFISMAGDALSKTDVPLKHIVVLGDGDADFQAQTSVRSLIEGLRAKQVTTSTVAVDVHGSQPNMAFMQDMATWGGGRFYQSNSPSQVPDLFLKEAQVSLRPWFEQEPFFPKVTAAGNLLDGVPLDAFPQLGGYVVSTPKPAAEVYFTSPKQDPVLAAWSYGAGRSVAWTSDSNGVWTAGLLRSPVSQSLFGHMLLWTLPTGTGDRLTVDSTPSGDGFDLTVKGPETSGGVLTVGLVTPALESASQDLLAVGPGTWKGHVQAGDVGTYLVHAALAKGGQTVASSDAAVSVPYSPEYVVFGRDEGFLRELAHEGSGVMLTSPAAAWKQPSLPVPINSEVFWFLLIAVACLWPLDIAMRRLTLTPRQLGGLVRAMVALRRPEEIEIAAPEELQRLRRRVAGMRRRRTVEVPAVMTGTGNRPSATDAGAESADQMESESLSARLLETKRRRGSGG